MRHAPRRGRVAHLKKPVMHACDEGTLIPNAQQARHTAIDASSGSSFAFSLLLSSQPTRS
jgi:hypothetical protein